MVAKESVNSSFLWIADDLKKENGFDHK